MNPRAFLVRGLLVGLLAGVATFVVAYTVGEPHVQAAIILEDVTSATEAAHTHADSEAAADSGQTGHTHADDETEVSRHNQRTWGLLTGTLTIGVFLGGLFALIAAAGIGRLGRLTPAQSTAALAAIGFVSYSLVPFLKYPATPPAVGNGDTIGARTTDYFALVLVSLVAAIVAVAVARTVWARFGALNTAVVATAGYLMLMVVAGQVFPTVNEIGDFPADTLWYFRRASLLTLVTLWLVIGVGMTYAARSLEQRSNAVAARRELAASL